MADDERRSSKRSRFDQTEPEVKRSRFDRRSRSPPSKTSEARRSRSPLVQKSPLSPGSGDRKGSLDPAAAAGKLDYPRAIVWRHELTESAAAAAARINASIQAKKGIHHVDVPPIRAVSLIQSSTPDLQDLTMI